MSLALVDVLVLFGVGLAAGTLNVVAAGGSFLTLPVLIDLGLTATVANGTNRVGILCQNVVAVGRFRRAGLLDDALVAHLRAALPPALAGAVMGVGLALRVDPATFERFLAAMMVVFALITLARRPAGPDADGGSGVAGASTAPARVGWTTQLGFFGAGVYGGFVQAGAGFLLLALASRCGLGIARGNALKVAVVLGFTVLSLALFAWGGAVAWLPGLALGAGFALGGALGARFNVRAAERQLRAVVAVALIVFAVRLLLRA
ncbi:MAG: sulfite exporter TauE/SafE family protein [Acidobacteriota bacterium]